MPEYRWLVLSLEAPLLAFGGVTIDHLGVTRDFPAASMLTGFLANALGYQRTEQDRHQSLQDRLIFAARREREDPAGILTDTQNALLKHEKRGWTTWGILEERGGGSLDSPHRRRRDYHVDARVTVVFRLADADRDPDLDRLAGALDRPSRPLFIGRKPCLPTGRINCGFVDADTAHDALRKTPGEGTRALWPANEGPEAGPEVDRVIDLNDLRNWRTGLHGGTRRVVEGRAPAEGNAA